MRWWPVPLGWCVSSRWPSEGHSSCSSSGAAPNRRTRRRKSKCPRRSTVRQENNQSDAPDRHCLSGRCGPPDRAGDRPLDEHIPVATTAIHVATIVGIVLGLFVFL